MDSNLHSAQKLRAEIQASKLFRFLMTKEQKEEAERIENQLNHTIEVIEKYYKYFSDSGWCLYDSMNIKVAEKAVIAYETQGKEEGEQVLLSFYKSDVKEVIHWIKNKAKPFMDRYDLIQKAFDDHFNKRYYASIPLFLIIIDGAVNDFTQSKGFFAEKTDVSAWDCLVGCDDSLLKMKKIYTLSRTKTNNDEISIPYRNGILHGRDLNYGNEYVSCKCVALLFALADWMQLKSNEDNRKEKFEKENNPPPISESLSKIKQLKEDKKIISEWKPRKVIIGQDIPIRPKLEDCKQYPYVIPIIKTFEAWQKRNYGELSKHLKKLFSFEVTDSKRAGECKKLFSSKQLIDFEIHEIEERGCCLTRILTKATWEKEDETITELLEFGSAYLNQNDETASPWRNNGEWQLIPWKIQGLYK
jgi:hypothetical protein